MEISNPLASQYISNQGLASQLNTQGNQLPVKSDRFSVEQKIPAPTEDEQRLRSEAEKRKRTSENTDERKIGEALANKNSESNPALEDQQKALATTNNLLSDNNRDRLTPYKGGQGTELSPTLSSEQNNQPSTPIKHYLETSALNSGTKGLSQIDFFI